MCAYSVFNTFPVYPLSAKPLILLAFCRYRYHTSLFNRPGFQSMIAEIEAGHIATVIVKDMSRFGRNYLEVGFYTEIQFPSKGVRFIAINNNVDSANPTDNDFTPFLNIMNEWYAKDTSNKIRAVFKSRMQDGKRCSGSIPYGYKRVPGDKQTLHIDAEAAAVVRRIFDMAASGASLAQIGQTLSDEKVLIPSAYEERYHPESARHHSYHDPYRWNTTTLTYILDRQEYLGHTVLCKSIRENFKLKKRRAATPEERIIFKNTHEAIIDQETWDKAQRLRKRNPKKLPNGTYSHRLAGMVFCADCGSRMSFSSPESKHRDFDVVYDSDSSWQCSKYRNMYVSCTSHFIKTSTIEAAILNEESEITHENIEKWFDANYSSLSKTEHSYLAAQQLEAALKQVIRYADRQHGNWSTIQQAEVDVSLVKPDYIIDGKIDLIKGEGDTVEIVDFKSERKPDLEKSREKLEQYRRQLNIYAYLVEERTGKKVSRMNLYYTGEENGVPIVTFPYTKTAIDGTMAAFDDTVQRILKKDFHHCANDEKICKNCDFKYFCRSK